MRLLDLRSLLAIAIAALTVIGGAVITGTNAPVWFQAASAGSVRLAPAPLDVETLQDHLVIRVDGFIADEERGIAVVAAHDTLIEHVDEAWELAEAEVRGEIWDRLADCESGDWMHSWPMDDTRRWDYGLTFSHGDIFEGGVNFHPKTWDAFRDADMPGHAGRATREQQIVVAERVLAAQGWKAWPVCSRMLGLR